MTSILKKFALILAFLLFLVSCGGDDDTVKKDPVRPVKFGVVEYMGETQDYGFSGTAKSSRQAKISFRANGLVEKVRVKGGDKVKAGQVIATLDDSDAQLALQEAKSALEGARVQKNNAESSLSRSRELYQVGSSSLAEYEQAKAQFANAESQFESAKKAFDLQQIQLGYYTLKAPRAGIISNVSAEENELVQAGSPIVTLNSGEDIELEVSIPQVFISQIEEGENVTVVFTTNKSKIYQGKVSEVSYAAGQSNTYPVVISVSNPSENIRPGMTAEVTFTFRNRNSSQKLIAPVDAVGEDNSGHFVYLLTKKDGVHTAMKKTIQIGELTNQGFEVNAGLQQGDLVATAGISTLYDGRKVVLIQ